MSILRDQDALVVYRQELGAPVALTSVTVDRDANINFTSGETYTVDTENTGTDVNGEAAESTGTGLTLDILLVDGRITDTRIVDAGTGYKKNDVLTVVGGTGKVYAADVGLDGEVTLVATQDAGSGYSVSKGFLNPIEAQGGTGSGLIVLPVITGGQIATFTPVGTVFQPIQSDGDAVDYTVGDEIRFETAPGQVYATATVAYVNITGQSQSSGGAFRYDGEQLFDDVDERINNKFDTTPADIRVETVDFDRTDGTHKFEGDLTLEQEADPSVTSVITFQRSGAVDYVVDDYGYNFQVDSNEYDTSKAVDTQAEFNKKIYQKVQFIEDNIYFPRLENDTKLNNELPRLHVDTEVKTLGTYNNFPDEHYDRIPSYTDVTQVKSIADGNSIEIDELRNEFTNFETGGLIFKGNVNALNQVPLLADTSVGWFWVASEDYTDAELGDIEEGVTIAVREDGDDDKAFQYIYRTSYDGIFLALNNETDIPQVVKGTVEFDIAGAKEFSITDNGIPIFNLDASGGNFTQQIRFDARTEHSSVYFHKDGNSVGRIIPDYYNDLLYYMLDNQTLVGHHFYSGVNISPDGFSNSSPGILEITGKSPSDDVATAYIKLGYSNSSDSYIRYYRTNTVELETGTFQTEASLKLNAGSGDSYLSSNVDSAAADCSVSYAGLISEDSHITNKKYVDDEITAKIDETIDYIDEKTDLSLGELNDVTLSNLESGQVLTFQDDDTWGTSKALTLNVADDTNTLTSHTWVRTNNHTFFIQSDASAVSEPFIVLSKGGQGALVVTSEGEVILGGAPDGFIATEPQHAVSKQCLDNELDSRETTIKEHVADGYVSKLGDTMTGDLSVDKSANGPASGGSSGKEAALTLKGDRTGTTHAVGTIQFANASAPSKTGNLTYRTDTDKGWFNLNAEVNISNDGLKTNEISTYSGSILEFNKKMDFTQTGDVNARFMKGFVIKQKGQTIDGNNIFSAYSDFVEYNGPTNTDSRIANRKWIWDNTVRDYRTDKTWSETSGLFIDAKNRGKVQNPGGSLLNKHNYEFLVTATGYGSFYVIGNDACVRNDLYVKSFAENSNPKGNRVATVSNSRSMMSGMRQAILGATDFENLKSRLLAKLEELENSNEFSEEPTPED